MLSSSIGATFRSNPLEFFNFLFAFFEKGEKVFFFIKSETLKKKKNELDFPLPSNCWGRINVKDEKKRKFSPNPSNMVHVL
jgi:hypothetical protein